MSKDKKLVKLNRLAKLKYTKLVSEEGNPESRKFQVSPWIILITLMCYAISVIMGEIFCYYTGFSRIISSENVGDYIGLFSTHCSVVFLTTSLMTMLSESSKYVYHIDLVRLVLIEPPCYNFFALVTYSLSSIVLAVLGFFVKRSSLILGGLVFGIVSIVVLFVRMVNTACVLMLGRKRVKAKLHFIIKNEFVKKRNNEYPRKRIGSYRKEYKQICS